MGVHMKRKLFCLALTSIVAGLCSCGASESEISLFKANSELIGTLKENPENPNIQLPAYVENIYSSKLPTYHRKGKGDVPYVEVKDFANALGEALPNVINKGITTEVKDGSITLFSPDKKGEIVLNPTTDEVKMKNTGSFNAPVVIDNGSITGDYGSARGNSIRGSEKSKRYMADGSAVPEYETVSFKDYDFDIYSQDGKFYAPMDPLSKVIFRDIGVDIAFNGADFHTNMLTKFGASRIYSSKGVFQGLNGVYEPSKTKGEGEAYRFESHFERAKDDNGTIARFTRYLILNDNPEKTAACVVCEGDTYDPTNPVEDSESVYKFTWKKEGETLIVHAPNTEQYYGGDYVIHLDETNFLKGTMSSEMANYNFNLLRYMFDHIYGLKTQKGYKDANAYFDSLGVTAGLKSTDAQTYNEAFSKLLGGVDDGHTAHSGLSIFTSLKDADSLNGLRQKYLGPRVTKLGGLRSKYSKARNDKYNELHPERPGTDDPVFHQGIKFSEGRETAIITFDGFTHNALEIKNMREMFPEPLNVPETDFEINVPVRAAFANSTPDGFSTAFEMLRQLNKSSKVVKNVVLDLTCNGGGAIMTLPYLAAFFTDDPVYTLQETNTKAISEYHYKVDLNGDGVFGGEGDTFKNDFNWFVLTSGFSFSCGNCLPGMAKDAGVKIIGEQSGGGVSPVGVYFDALGSTFNISNHLDMLYKKDGVYTQNDDGIPLDRAFPFDNGNWYDPNAVNTFIKGLN